MYYYQYVDQDAESFEFWDDAKENIDKARTLGTEDQVFEILEEMFSEGDVSDAQINDYVGFHMPEDYPELFGEGEDEDFTL